MRWYWCTMAASIRSRMRLMPGPLIPAPMIPLDEAGRPTWLFGATVHEGCDRGGYYEQGQFATEYGSDHRCLVKLGCKGPVTFNSCSTRHFNEVVDAWPIGIGAPCFGCTEQFVGYTIPAFQTVPISQATPPSTYPEVETERGVVQAAATGAAGLAGGILLGAGYVAARKFSGFRSYRVARPRKCLIRLQNLLTQLRWR